MKKILLTTIAFGMIFSLNLAQAKKTKTVKLNESEQMFWAKQEQRIKSVTSADRKAMPYLTLSEYSELTLVEQVRYVKLLRHSLALANKLQTQFYKKNNKRVISSLWWLTGHDAEAHRRNDGAEHTHDYKDIGKPGIHTKDNISDSLDNSVTPSTYRSSINEPFQRDKGDYAILYGELCPYRAKGKASNHCGYNQTYKNAPCKNKGGRSCGYLTGLSSYHGNMNACIEKAPRHGNGTESCVAKAHNLTLKQEKQADAVYKYIKQKLREFRSSSSKTTRSSTDCNTRFASASYEEWDACRKGRNISETPNLVALKTLVSSLKYENIKDIVVGKDADGKDILLRDSGLVLEDLRVDPRVDATLLYLAAINNEVTKNDDAGHKELLALTTDFKDSVLTSSLNKGKAYEETINSQKKGYAHVMSVVDEYNKGVQIFDQMFEGTMQHCSRGVAEDLHAFADVDRKQNPRVKDLSFQKRDCEALVGNGCPTFSCEKYTTNNGKAAGRLCSVKDALVKLNSELTQGCAGKAHSQKSYRKPKTIFDESQKTGTAN